MKKITIVSSFPPIKGVSYYTVGFLEAMDKLCDIQFLGFNNIYPEFLYKGGSKDKTLRIPILHNTHLWNKINWYNPLSWIIAGFKIKGKIIHVQRWSWILAPIYFTVLFIAKYIKKSQVVMTVHNVLPHEKSFLKNMFNNSVYRLADKFIVHSNDNKKQLETIIGTSKKIQVIPHGIIYPSTVEVEKNIARKKYNLQEQDKVLLFFGNIRDYKGLDILLESLSLLTHKDKTYKLIIAGSIRGGRDKYQKIIDDNNLQGHIVRLDGFIPEPELGYIFGASDLLVLPYKHFDAQSGVIALNFAFNLPLLVSNLGGLTEAIEDNDLIFEVGNIHQLEQKIRNIFENNLLEKKILYVKERKGNFEWDKIAEKTLDFYKI